MELLTRAAKALQLANQEAQRFNQKYLGTEDILLGLMKEGSGVASRVLRQAGLDLRIIRMEVAKYIQTEREMTTGKLPLTPRARRVVRYAVEECDIHNAINGSSTPGNRTVNTEHLLLGLLREEQGLGIQVLEKLGINPETLKQGVLDELQYGSDEDE